MRQLITDYTFDAEARTVTSPAFTSLEVILIITNLTSNRIIYNFASNGKGGSLEDTILTLGYDTSDMANDDVLQIYCEVPEKVDDNGFPQVSLATRLAGEDPVYDAIHNMGATAEFVGQSSQAGQDVLVVPGIFSAGFSRFSMTVSGTWTGSLTVSSGGGDGQYFNKPVTNDVSANAPSSATVTTNGVYYGDVNADVLRVFAGTLTGTVAVKIVLTSAAGGRPTMGVVATQSGTWNVGPVIAGSAARTSVASSVSTVTLLASNTNRKQAFFYNDSSASLYLAFGTAASATSFTVKVAPGGFFELPTPPIYSGIVTGFWDSENGSVRVTEVT